MPLTLPHLTKRQRVGLGGAVLLALGAAGGAGAVSLTRPTVEMAPTVPTAIASLPASHGIVTVRGRVTGVYGDHFMVEDRSGRTLVDIGRGAMRVGNGAPILVQGRFDDGRLRARFMVDQGGEIVEVGGPEPRPPLARPAPPPGPGAPAAAPTPPPPPGGPGVLAPPPPSGVGVPPAPAPAPAPATASTAAAPTPK